MLQSVRRTQEGRKCAAFDLDYDPVYMNMNSAPGFAHAIYQVLRLERGSSMTLAPVCGSWVWMFAGSTLSGGGVGDQRLIRYDLQIKVSKHVITVVPTLKLSFLKPYINWIYQDPVVANYDKYIQQ